MKNKLLIASMVSLLLVGCSGHKVQTLEYYKTHIDEAQKVAKDCKMADKTDKNVLQDCKNAVGALTWKMFSNGAASAPAYGTYKINPSFGQ